MSDDDVWFHERGHHGNRFRLTFVDTDGGARRPSAESGALVEMKPPPAASALSTAEQMGASLTEMLATHDFSGYAALARLQREDPQAPPEKLPPGLLDRFNRQVPVSHDERLTITALMDYFMRQRHESVDRLIGKRSGRFELIRKFFDISHQLAGDAADYFPDDILEELNEFVLADGVFELPLSRLMLWHWMSENRALAPDLSAERENIFWWWVTGAMPANRIPDVFIPAPVKSHLAGAHEGFRGRTIELSRFAFRAYCESEQLRLRYDLKTAAGLIGYSFDFILHNASNPINRHFVGSAVRAWWAAPVHVAGRTFSRFELALTAQIPQLQAVTRGEADLDLSRKARLFLDTAIPSAAPEWRPYAAVRTQQAPKKGGDILLPSTAAAKARR
ncbi:MAG: hypothetical protein ACRCTI_13450, partial [Beijerinckiaceae bacterium]